MPGPMRRQQGAVQKAKNFKGTMIRLFHHLKNFHGLLYISVILAIVSAILALVSPNKLSDLTDIITDGIKPNINEKVISDIMQNPDIPAEDKMEFSKILSEFTDTNDTNAIISKLDKLPSSIYNVIKPSIDMGKVKKVALLLTSLYLISTIFSYVQALLMTNVSNNFAKNLRSQISNKINLLPLKYFDNHETGNVLSRVTNDVDTIAQGMNQSLSTLVSSITLFLGSIIMMFITNWVMAITAIVASFMGFCFMGIILSKSQKYFSQRQKELGSLNGYIEEMYSGHNVVKAYNGDKEASNVFSTLNNKLYICNRKSQFLSGLMPPLMNFIGNFGYVAV